MIETMKIPELVYCADGNERFADIAIRYGFTYGSQPLRKFYINQKQLKEVEKAIANLLDIAEHHPSADVMTRLSKREQERDTLKRDLDRLHQQTETKNPKVDERVIVNLLTDMKHKLREGELRVRKLVLRQVVEQIEIGRDVARIHYRFPLYPLYSMPPTTIELKDVLVIDLS